MSIANLSYSQFTPRQSTAQNKKPASKLLEYAHSLRKAEEYSKALAVCQEIIKTYPASAPEVAEAYFWIAEIYSKRYQAETALIKYRKFITKYPNHFLVSLAFDRIGDIYKWAGYSSDSDTTRNKKYLLAIEAYQKSLSQRESQYAPLSLYQEDTAGKCAALYCRLAKFKENFDFLKQTFRDKNLLVTHGTDFDFESIRAFYEYFNQSYLKDVLGITIDYTDPNHTSRADEVIFNTLLILPSNLYAGLKEIKFRALAVEPGEKSAIIVNGKRKLVPLRRKGGDYNSKLKKIRLNYNASEYPKIDCLAVYPDKTKIYDTWFSPDLVHEIAHHWEASFGRLHNLSPLFYNLSWQQDQTGEWNLRKIDFNDFVDLQLLDSKRNIYAVYGMRNQKEDLAEFAAEYVFWGNKLRSRIRQQFLKGNFELALKYLFMKLLVFDCQEYYLDTESYTAGSQSLKSGEIQANLEIWKNFDSSRVSENTYQSYYSIFEKFRELTKNGIPKSAEQ